MKMKNWLIEKQYTEEFGEEYAEYLLTTNTSIDDPTEEEIEKKCQNVLKKGVINENDKI